MILSKVFLLVAIAIGVQASTIASRNTSDVAFVPISTLGFVSTTQIADREPVQTRLFYQDSTGNILIHATTNGPFTTGTNLGARTLVPAAQVLRSTPIAATMVANGSRIEQHVFFFSPDHKLREYRYTSTGGWRGGSGCPGCIDKAGFAVTPGSNILYALEHPTNTGLLRVGFESPGAPGTLSEAVTTDEGSSWQLASFPDA